MPCQSPTGADKQSTATIVSLWLSQRVPIANFSFSNMKEKFVPVHKAISFYYLGGLTLASFLVQIVTGLLLLVYYKPTELEAYNSIQYIDRIVPHGNLLRNLHVWSANAMIVLLLLHAASAYFARSYRRPRELNWLTGSLALPVVLALAFSGYLLPWNNLAVYATKVGISILQTSTAMLPGLAGKMGAGLAFLLAGGQNVGPQTLTRFFALHIAVLPILLALLLALHLFLVQLHGVSIPHFVSNEEQWQGKKQYYFTEFLAKESAVWLLFLAALITLATILPYDCFLPYTFLSAYDPLAPAPIGIKPEWYFLFLYYPLEILPRPLVIGAAFLVFSCVLLAPWLVAALPRLWKADPDKSAFATLSGLLLVVLVLGLTLGGEPLVAMVRQWH